MRSLRPLQKPPKCTAHEANNAIARGARPRERDREIPGICRRARLDRSEPIEDDEQAQVELASDLSKAFDDTVHSHCDKIRSSRRWTSGRRARSRKAQR